MSESDVAELARIRAEAQTLYGRIGMWVSDNRGNPWALQLVADMGRVVGTVKWIEGVIERARIDAEKRARGE